MFLSKSRDIKANEITCCAEENGNDNTTMNLDVSDVLTLAKFRLTLGC